jgi:diguanylate cyclase (GGDEF)-like protein
MIRKARLFKQIYGWHGCRRGGAGAVERERTMKLTMKGKRSRGLSLARHRVRRRLLLALVFLAVLPLPIVAYVLGAHVVMGASAETDAQQIMSSQVLLVLTAILVVGVGGFLIWSTTASLTRGMDGEARLHGLNEAIVDRLEERAPLVNSVTRMLTTIERQSNELNHFAQRLDTAYRELESTNVRLQEVSFTDEVTRLYNRRFYSVRLEEEVARYRRFGHPLSLVLIDLDDFKTINDELGHQGGDETLRGVAEVLMKSSRGIDVICRYGGDEFAVLLVETPRSGAALYAERIREVLSSASFSHGRQVSASLGVASLPEDTTGSDELIRLADEALYAAKRAGKNRVVVCRQGGAAGRPQAEVPLT